MQCHREYAVVDEPTYHGWRRNLAVVWLAQFLALTAFGFGLPFVAYFIQEELGITDPDAVLRTLRDFAAAAPLVFMISAPFWGAMADRYGRKPMLVRANIAAAVVLIGMGLSQSVFWLLVFRVGQGLFTGTIAAAMTLGVSSAPANRQGLVLGILASALQAGIMAGQFLGGLSAEWFGYRASFMIGGGLALAAALVVAFWAKEDFVQRVPFPQLGIAAPSGIRQRVARGLRSAGAGLGPLVPFLLLIVLVTFTIMMEQPLLPLVVQDLNDGSVAGAATLVGTLGAVVCLCAMPAGFGAGWMTTRWSVSAVVLVAALAAGCATIPLWSVNDFTTLFVAKGAMAMCAGCLDPALQAWLNQHCPPDRRGMVFGISSATRSLAWFGAPICSAALAAHWGVRSVYPAMAVGFAVVALAVLIVARRQSSAQPGPADGAADADSGADPDPAAQSDATPEEVSPQA